MTITDVVTLVIMALGFYLTWKKAPLESRKLAGEAASSQADTAARWQEIANNAAKREAELRSRLDTIELQMATLQIQAREAMAKAARFEDWATRLSHQVISLGGHPVPLDVEDKE